MFHPRRVNGCRGELPRISIDVRILIHGPLLGITGRQWSTAWHHWKGALVAVFL
jgi:hypothetical protein